MNKNLTCAEQKTKTSKSVSKNDYLVIELVWRQLINDQIQSIELGNCIIK